MVVAQEKIAAQIGADVLKHGGKQSMRRWRPFRDGRDLSRAGNHRRWPVSW